MAGSKALCAEGEMLESFLLVHVIGGEAMEVQMPGIGFGEKKK